MVHTIKLTEHFNNYRASNSKKIWSLKPQIGCFSAPISAKCSVGLFICTPKNWKSYPFGARQQLWYLLLYHGLRKLCSQLQNNSEIRGMADVLPNFLLDAYKPVNYVSHFSQKFIWLQKNLASWMTLNIHYIRGKKDFTSYFFCGNRAHVSCIV